ncbi:NAD+ synthase [Permianibacter aggregans]|uniref:Glutamine-dependent NAD(+) synthetase n=1 Tax=Permianibacter aggregans TaxID=1510150 RepID=A0A4R6UZ41_9GAMM|nr:NAD+ synthase [Permianibacter aggregans]QGX41480.1 NAD+ synthase [Permianibacter aggregans]TDQ51273.1 NAD+ synthase (glutamine-hydrolysing) [Permianibacter aggregans]
MRIALVQLNVIVGDMQHNTARMLTAIEQAKSAGAELIVFSEQVVCGYPAEDLVLRADFLRGVEHALSDIAKASHGVAIVVGHPERYQQQLYNSASVFADGQHLVTYRKQRLPNYLVFDEHRYFSEGEETCVFHWRGRQVGLLICEDLWHPEPIAACKAAGAELVLSPNGSPWHKHQNAERLMTLSSRHRESGLPIVYVNQVGGQDELIFDGQSQVWEQGHCVARAKLFADDLLIHELFSSNPERLPERRETSLDEIFAALVVSVRDYVQKNGFKGVLLGLSGGIDSALTLVIACEAIGAENVRAVMMPYRYTASMSIEDARQQAAVLGAGFDIIDIAPMVDSFMKTLAPHFAGTAVDVTEQNLQARCRGTTLMALSNKFGSLVLTTGNKSEMAVGYATLYGDMAGGFDVLKDLPKMLVYQLSEWCNRETERIPRRVIERAPSAELAPDQKDEDNLPPYPVLDAILERYIERDWGLEEIVKDGFDRDVVRRVMQLVDRAEYKRRQSAPGPRISKRAFGRDRRYPITSGFSRQSDDWR